MKKFVIAAGLVVAGGVAVAAVVRPSFIPGLNAGPSAVSTIPRSEVRQGTFEVSVASIGELKAANSTVLSAPYGGKIIKLLPEGTRVSEGDPVVWFETEEDEQELEEELAQLALEEKDLEAAQDAFEMEKVKNRFTLESEKTKVEIAQKEFEDAKQKYQAEQVLFQQNISPETKLDEARLSLLQAELSLRDAEINLAKVQENLASNLRVKEREIEKQRLRVEKRKTDVDEVQRRIDKSIITATGPGDIAYLKTWKSGQVSKIVEGDTVWRRTSLAEIPDTSVMVASVPVNEIDYNKIKEGQRADVRVDALPGKVFSGEVISKSVAPISDPNQRSYGNGEGSGPNEYEVKVQLEGTNDLFRQGMTASARIVVEEMENATYIPLESLMNHDGEQGVWTAPGDDAEFTPLRVVMVNENYAAVEGPVQPGTSVLLAPPGSEGMPELPVLDQPPVEATAVQAAPEAPPTTDGAS